MTTRRSLGSIAALCTGACFIWSCQGDVGSGGSIDSPGAKGGASGAANKTVNGAAGRPVTGGSGSPASGAAGQPVGAAAGQPVGGAAGQPAGGAAGQAGSGAVVPPASGAAGQPAGGAAGQAGSGSTAPPTSGAAGQPATGTAGQAGSGSAVPPTTGTAGQAGSGSVAPPATGAAGHPAGGATGQAGSGNVVPPTSGAAGQAGSGNVAPPMGGAAGTTAPPATSAGASIVPLYTDPSDPSWNAIVAAKMAHPKVGVIAIVNPADGPGGAAQSGYTAGIARLNAAGIKVIGYVATGYASKTAAVVEADIDRWKAFYPGQLGGIFFDEQSNRAADVAHYRELSQYAKSQGLSFTVGNPGTDTDSSYIGTFDAMLIYETDGLPSTSQMGGWHTSYPPSNFGIIPYAVSMDATFVHSARKYVEYIYLQSDSLPNPWDSLPSYFADLLAALE